MKVCHIVAGYYPLNAAPFEYTRKLASFGTAVDVIAFGRPREATRELVDGVAVKRIPLTRSRRFSWRNTYKFVMAALTLLKTEYYDLVHVYAFRGCCLLPLWGRHLAGHWLLDIRTGNVSNKPWRSWMADRVTALESNAFDTCIAINEGVGKRVLGSNRTFHVVPLGVDLAKFKPARNLLLRRKLGIPDDHLTVVFTSKLEPQRTPNRVLQGFAQATQVFPNLLLLVVGDGTMLAELQSLAKTLAISDKVCFTGYVPYIRVQDYVNVADVGLAYVPITPQYMAQPPLKTVEFLACGLPTLATNTLGNSQFIRKGENGLLVDDTPAAIAAGLMQLAGSESLRRQLAGHARASIEAYDWLNIVKTQLMPFYDQTMERDGLPKAG